MPAATSCSSSCACTGGFDTDLTADVVRLSNRLLNALTSVSPALERAGDGRLDAAGVRDLLAAYPTPSALRTAGRARIQAKIKRRSPRLAAKVTEAVVKALDAGEEAAGKGCLGEHPEHDYRSGDAGCRRRGHDPLCASDCMPPVPGEDVWFGGGHGASSVARDGRRQRGLEMPSPRKTSPKLPRACCTATVRYAQNSLA